MANTLPPLPDPAGIGVNIPLDLATPPITKAENDLYAAWHTFAKQIGPVAHRRLKRATFYRAQLKKIVSL